MTEDGRRVFVGFLPRVFQKDDIIRVFDPFGRIRRVEDLSVKTSTYGCCILEFKNSNDARNCYEGTNGRFKFPGQPRPILVKIVTSEKQLARAKEDVCATPYPFELGAGQSYGDESNEEDDETTDSLGIDSSTRTELEMLRELESSLSYIIPPTGVKIFVGSIPFHMTKEDLRDLFKQYGDIVNTYVKDRILSDGTRKSDGCGFVWFANFKGAYNAVKALNGKVMFKSYKTPLTVRTSDELKKSLRECRITDKLKLCKIFVKNLPPNSDDDFLKSLFSKYGKVARAFVPIDKEKGTRKEHGFVYYEDSESAKRAIAAVNGIALPTGERLEVEYKRRFNK